MKQSEQVYSRFKDALLNNVIRLGDTLTQAQLADLLDTQISPLRVAVQKLETEGLVRILPRSGVQIVKPDMNLIRNSYHLRKIIEAAGIETYTRHATDSDIQSLIKLNETVASLVDKNGTNEDVMRAAADADKETHDAFIAILNNELVTEVYEKNKDKIRLIRLDKPIHLSRLVMQEISAEHLSFLRAVEARDSERAITKLEEHLDKSLKRAMGIF